MLEITERFFNKVGYNELAHFGVEGSAGSSAELDRKLEMELFRTAPHMRELITALAYPRQIVGAGKIKSKRRTFGIEIEVAQFDTTLNERKIPERRFIEFSSDVTTDLTRLLNQLKIFVKLFNDAQPWVPESMFYPLHLSCGYSFDSTDIRYFLKDSDPMSYTVVQPIESVLVLLTTPNNWPISCRKRNDSAIFMVVPREKKTVRTPGMEERAEIKELSIGLGPASDVDYIGTIACFVSWMLVTDFGTVTKKTRALLRDPKIEKARQDLENLSSDFHADMDGFCDAAKNLRQLITNFLTTNQMLAKIVTDEDGHGGIPY